MSLLRSSLLDSHGFHHGFGTRQTTPDELPSELYTLRQVHGDRIIALAEPLPEKKNRFTQGDALVASLPGVFVGVRTADCLPVLLADPVSGAVAAVHCGWRSLAAEITAKAVGALLEVTGTDPGNLIAALGPAIGLCCYEVGEDVRKAFMIIPGVGLSTEHRNGSIYASLKDAAASQLMAVGVGKDNIDTLDQCTSCDRDILYSFRGERTDKRMMSFIGPGNPQVT